MNNMINKTNTIGRMSLLVASLVIATPASAALFFTEDFNTAGGLPGPNLEQASGGAAAIFSANAATFPAPTFPDRSYLRTVDDDYHSVDFVAEVTVTIFDNGSAGNGTIFFGFGQGDRLTSFFDEPRSGSHLFLRGYHDNFRSGRADVTDDSIEGEQIASLAGTGTHRLRMTWDSVQQELTFAMHHNYSGGPFVAGGTFAPLDGSDNGFNASNSRIFFGAANGSIFDDLSITSGATIVPLPAAMWMFLSGFAGLLVIAVKKAGQDIG